MPPCLDDILSNVFFNIVSPEETRRLFKRFIRLDSDMSGGLDMHEVFKLQRVSDNPLAHRFLEIFDKDKDGIVDFSEFMEGMAVFSRPGYSEKKLKFLFDIYDVNNDGFLSNGDLFKALKLMVGENLDDASLQVRNIFFSACTSYYESFSKLWIKLCGIVTETVMGSLIFTNLRTMSKNLIGILLTS